MGNTRLKNRARAQFYKEHGRFPEDDTFESPDYDEVLQNQSYQSAKEFGDMARGDRQNKEKAYKKKDQEFKDKAERIKRSIMWKALKRG